MVVMQAELAIRVGSTGALLDEPENVVMTANKWGSDRAAFDIHRDPKMSHPDLLPRTAIEFEIGGVRVWKGRIRAAPAHDGRLTVDCEGLQYALDDNPFRRLYVHTNVQDWRNWTAYPEADPVKYTAGWQIETGGSVMIRNTAVTGSFPKGGVYLDLGQSDVAKRIVLEWSKNQWAGTSTAYFYASDTASDLNTAAGATSITNLASATTSGTFAATTSARYLLIFCDTDTAQASDRYFRVGSILVFGNTAWESGNASVLTASDVVEDAILQAAGWTDTSGIVATADVLRSLDALTFTTGRELIDTVNAFSGYVTKVDADGRMVFKPQPATPLFYVPDAGWFTDDGYESTDDVYDEVAIVGTGPDGGLLIVERSQTGTVFDRLSGEHGKKVVDITGAITQETGEGLGDAFLAAHQQSPFRGSITVDSSEMVTGAAGEPIDPWRLLRETGEMISLLDQVDGNRKTVGRRGYITSVSYDHTTRAAKVDIDSSRGDFAVTLARYGVGLP